MERPVRLRHMVTLGVGVLTIGVLTAAAPLRASAANPIFLQATGNDMQCSLVSASTSPMSSALQNQTVWSCAGAAATDASPAGTTAGTVLLTASTPAGPADCGAGTSALFQFTYVDAFGKVTWSGNVPYIQSGILCQTNYAGLSTALAVSANAVNGYPLMGELCQFAIEGPLGGEAGFGTSVTLTFSMDSNTGCAPRNT